MKRNVIVIILIVIGLIWYFFRGSNNNNNNDNNSRNTDNQDQNSNNDDKDKGKGWIRDTAKFNNTYIFTPLDPNSPDNQLPSSVSLRQYAPTPMNQGEQGSCTGWSTSYAARTILESVASGSDPNNAPFSPSYIFNQEHGSNCNGAVMYDVLTKLSQEGTLPLSEFPYDARSCDRTPSSQQRNEAHSYKILGFNRLTNGQNFNIDLTSMKQNIAKGAPVIIGMPVGGTLMNLARNENNGLWKPTDNDYNALEDFRNGDYRRSGLGGHAICVIGYDDNKFGGSVEIQNSWGKDFGDGGFFWMKYKDFKNFCMEAYGLFPFPSAKANTNQTFKASLGLIINKTKENIMFKSKQGNVFETKNILPDGTKFKVQINNSTPCYVYVIGQDTDGSSYTLFPYTKKHSPFCGITGTRTFPTDYSMQLDNVGNKDVIAFILTKSAIDINKIKDLVTKSTGTTYAQKIKEALNDALINDSEITFSTDKTINIEVGKTNKNAVAIVMEINKK